MEMDFKVDFNELNKVNDILMRNIFFKSEKIGAEASEMAGGLSEFDGGETERMAEDALVKKADIGPDLERISEDEFMALCYLDDEREL